MIEPETVFIEGSSFLMGSNESKDEQPVHLVNLPDFYIGKYPVTNSQFAAFLNAYGSEKVKNGQFSGQQIIDEHEWGIQKTGNKWIQAIGYEHHPVIGVTWFGAIEYCSWLNETTSKRYHLPSESEWEYAARGGNKSLGFRYSGGNKLKEVGWCSSNSHNETKPVGLKLPNELGIYDMSGNVWEWCTDHWYENYTDAPNDGSAWITDGGPKMRVVRGGSWSYDDGFSRVSDRVGSLADNWSVDFGFRVARY